MTKNVPGRIPEFDEISGRVTEDAIQAGINEKSESIIREIVDSYKIKNIFKPTQPINDNKPGGNIQKQSNQKGADIAGDPTGPESMVGEGAPS